MLAPTGEVRRPSSNVPQATRHVPQPEHPQHHPSCEVTSLRDHRRPKPG